MSTGLVHSVRNGVAEDTAPAASTLHEFGALRQPAIRSISFEQTTHMPPEEAINLVAEAMSLAGGELTKHGNIKQHASAVRVVIGK